MNYSELEADFGTIGLCWEGHRLARLLLSPAQDQTLSALHRPGGSPRSTLSAAPAPDWIREQLAAYLADPCYRMDCPIAPSGSAFAQRVWDCIAAIPPGCTRTYGAIAAELGSSARAVGGACRANPVPLRIPCHRVVAASGLGGFAGDRSGRLLEIKRWLLAHESALRMEQVA